MSYGIRKFWCWTFTQQTSFYLTSYVTDMNYITHRRFFVHLYQPIHWYLPRILTFLSEQRAPISTMFASSAFHNVLWSQHGNVQVSIYVMCLNFAGTGSRLWQLYVAFVMTWYLAFTTSGPKAVRPVISGNYSPEKWLHKWICHPSNRSKQIQEIHTACSADTQPTWQSLSGRQHTRRHRLLTCSLWCHVCCFSFKLCRVYCVLAL